MPTLDVPGYEELATVLEDAYGRAARTKGAERHANNLPFHHQPILTIAKNRGGGFLLGQMDKKIDEARRLPREQALNELHDAIVYLAAYVLLQKETLDKPVAGP